MANLAMTEDEEMLLADDEDEGGSDHKYLLFRIGKETYGIAIKWVTGIEEMQKITMVPDMPDYVKGVINLRGKIIPAMSVRKRFHMEDREFDDRTCIIIVNIDAIVLGLIVDTVAEVLTIPKGSIEAPPDFRAGGEKDKYIEGLAKVGEDVKIILDCKRILYQEDVERLKEKQSAAAAK